MPPRLVEYDLRHGSCCGSPAGEGDPADPWPMTPGESPAVTGRQAFCQLPRWPTREEQLAQVEPTGHIEPRIGALRRELRRNPGSLCFAELADLTRHGGNLVEAAALCARGLLQHPGYATGRVVMGEIFRDQQLESKAEEEWREALRMDPNHPRARLRLGELYLHRGDVPRARAALAAALHVNPGLAEAEDLLATIEHQEAESAPRDQMLRRLTEPSTRTSPPVQKLLAAVGACSSVEGALLVNSDGLPVAGSLTAAANAEAGAAMAAQVVREARRVIAPLGAGRLRMALLRGSEGSVRCLVVEDGTLIVALKRDVPIGAADAELQELLAARRARERADQDAA